MNSDRLWVVMLALASIPPAVGVAQGVNYELVTVGNPGNSHDTTGYGGVPLTYRIGKYETTIGDYTAFLNAVAGDDTYSLFTAGMASEASSGGISRSFSGSAFTYSVFGPIGSRPVGADSPGNRPITFVSWFNAARFANWMSNGQPTGPQGPTTTENGAYDLSGPAAPMSNLINPNTGATPRYRIPTENEWYKAAYYSPTLNSGAGGYYAYATQSDTAPGNQIGGGVNQANCYVDDLTVTESSTLSYDQNYLTNVGAFAGSASAYGTFDQNGNASEWNDLDGTVGTSRGVRGASWFQTPAAAASTSRTEPSAAVGVSVYGFRLAASTDLLFRMPAGTTRTQSQALYPRLTREIATSVTIASGTVVFDANNSHTGPTFIKDATLQVRAPKAVGLTPITVQRDGILSLPSDTGLTLLVKSITIEADAGGLVDLGRGRIDIAPGGATAGDIYADILAGRAGGTYSGTSGISSRAVAAEILGSQPRAVGWLENTDGSLTVAYAAPGDTNCDWTVDILDAANFLAAGRFDTGTFATWSDGDFTYDQVVDILDAADFVATGLFDSGPYNASSESLAAVPEPSTCAMAVAGLVCGGFSMSGRRKRA